MRQSAAVHDTMLRFYENRLRGQAASDLGFPTPMVERYEVGVLEID